MTCESVDIGKSMIYVCTCNINSPSINVYCHCAGCSSRVLTVQDLFSPTKYYNYISDTRPGPGLAVLISLQICLICSSEPSAVQCLGMMQTCKQCLMLCLLMENVEIETLVQKCFTDWQFCLVFESPLCFSNGRWKDINRKKIILWL